MRRAATAEAWADALLAAGALSVDAADARAGTPTRRRATASRATPARMLGALPIDARCSPADADADAGVAARGRDARPRRRPRTRCEALHEQDWVREHAGAVRADRASPTGCGSCRRGASRSIPRRSISRSIPGWRSAPAAIRRRGCACAGSPSTSSRGESVLDYGCGSGILAIAAAKLGAATVTGTDVDPQAIEASRANAARNGVAAAFAASRCARAGQASTSSSPTSSPIPLRLLAPVLAARVQRAAVRSCSRASSKRRPPRWLAAYAPWFKLGAMGDATTDGWHWPAGART